MPAMAQTAFPDLRGTWKGESESIITDSGNPHHPGPPQSEHRLTSVPFTLTIDKQDGRRFSGTFSSPRSSEPIIGVITRGGTLLAVDTDGYAAGNEPIGDLLSPDSIIRAGGVLYGNDQAIVTSRRGCGRGQAWPARLRRSRSLLSGDQTSSIL